jgi:signal transduction histidine kinase
VLESILADPKYRLLRADHADLALRLLLEHDVAAIVLDIKMPGVSGFELARMIKNTKRFRETPLVFLTAYMVNDQDVIAGYGAGAVDYLTKPVNPQILRQKIAVFAELHRKTRELAEVNDKLARLNEKLEERVRERTAELSKSEEALKAAAAQKDEFLAVLAHELRNPLAPLRTGVDLLLRGQGSERTLAAMNRQLEHMVRLIDDLLDISRISRGLIELKRDEISLALVVSACVENAGAWLERRSQTVQVELDEQVFALVDQTRVSQIVTNVLHNATKFTPAGGAIRVTLSREEGFAAVRVVDSGIGLKEDQIGRVFDMFARIERPGVTAEPGLGIGLALARRLADLHGGTLTATSQGEGAGTTFTLRLPAMSGAREKSIPAEPLPGDANATFGIVVVEDNEDVADSMAEWLRMFGHRVTVTATGNDGVEAVRKDRPDVVLCDLGLPDIDGLDVCREVRKFAVEPRPVMIALTGWGRDEDHRRTREAGFDHHLVKPVDLEKLQTLIASFAIEPARADGT